MFRQCDGGRHVIQHVMVFVGIVVDGPRPSCTFLLHDCRQGHRRHLWCALHDEFQSSHTFPPITAARLIGQYSSDVAYGQRRVLVAWNRLIYPNGATIALQGMPGTDGLGQAGLGDQVDNHTMRVIGSALLISTLGVAGQLSQPQNTSVLTTPSAGQQAASAAATKLDDVGTQMLQKNLNIQPTLVFRPGCLFNVLVTRTMILPTYPE